MCSDLMIGYTSMPQSYADFIARVYFGRVMRKFLFRTCVFLVLAITTVVCVTLWLSQRIASQNSYAISPQKNMVVFGHSHSECAFNDSLIPGLRNFAFSGETYFYTFQKVKLLLNHNPQVKTVFFEWSNNQITEEMDDWTWNSNSLGKRLPEFGMFLDAQEKWTLFQNNPFGYLEALTFLPSSYLGVISRKEFDFVQRTGAFRGLNKAVVDSILIERARHPDIKPIHIPFSTTNPDYLRRCIDYCQERGVQVFLVRSPLHGSYERLENEKEFLSTIEQLFPDVPFLDFRKYALHQSDFADLEHLNNSGAEKFSRAFASLIEDGLLTSQSPDSLVRDALAHSCGR